MSEQSLQKAILDYLHLRGCIAFKVPSAGIYRADTKQYIPMSRKGVSDIIGIIPPRKEGEFGVPLAVEVKSRGGKLSAEQERFLKEWQCKGGMAIVAYSLDDILEDAMLTLKAKS